MALPLPLNLDLATSYTDDDQLISVGASDNPPGLIVSAALDADIAREAGWEKDIVSQLHGKLFGKNGTELSDWIKSIAEDQALLGALGDTLRITLTVTRNPL